MIADDRGARVGVFDMNRFKRGEFAGVVRDYEEAVKGAKWSWQMKVAAVATALMPGVGAVAADLLLPRSVAPRWVRVPVQVAAMGIAMAVWVHFHRRGMAGVARRVMLRHGRCAGCGYVLTGTPRGEDGCTVCPECGAAWRMDEDESA